MEEEEFSPEIQSTKKALKKVYMTMLKSKYPEIKGIVVSSTDLGFVVTYRVGIGLYYADLLENDDDRLENEVKTLSKYVLGKNERIEHVYYYDANY